jgi:hypothetical protein
MRRFHYRPKSFRISEKVLKNLKKIHKETGLSYNLLFSEMIRSYFKKLEKRRKVKENKN